MHISFFCWAGLEASEGIVGCNELDRKARSTGYCSPQRLFSDMPAIFTHDVTPRKQLPRDEQGDHIRS
jgi:hypothetical protein